MDDPDPIVRGQVTREETAKSHANAVGGPADDVLISEAQTAVLLGVAQRTLQGWRRNRTGPQFVRLTSRSIRYRRRDLVAWINARFEPRDP